MYISLSFGEGNALWSAPSGYILAGGWADLNMSPFYYPTLPKPFK